MERLQPAVLENCSVALDTEQKTSKHGIWKLAITLAIPDVGDDAEGFEETYRITKELAQAELEAWALVAGFHLIPGTVSFGHEFGTALVVEHRQDTSILTKLVVGFSLVFGICGIAYGLFGGK